jgi:Surface-adhesin protein E
MGLSFNETSMRSILLAVSGVLAVVACAGPPPELVKVSKTESDGVRFVTYADRATIKKTGNTVRMSSVIDPEVADNRRRLSWKDEWDYQCQDKLLQPHRYTQYSGSMGTGEKMYSDTVPSIYGWIPAVPGSVGEKLWQVACQEK